MRYKLLSIVFITMFASTSLFATGCSNNEKTQSETDSSEENEENEQDKIEQDKDKLADKNPSEKVALKGIVNNKVGTDATSQEKPNKKISKKSEKTTIAKEQKKIQKDSTEGKGDKSHKKAKKNLKPKNTKTAKAVVKNKKNKTKEVKQQTGSGKDLKIVDFGKEKKVALRYKFPSFKKTEYLKMQMITEVGMEIEGKSRPPRQAPVIVMIMKIVHQQKNKEQLTYKFSLDKVKVKKKEGVSEEQHKKMVATLKKNMKNLEGIANVNSKGEVNKIWFSKDFTYDVNLNQVMNNIKNQLKNMVVPLPTKKVGAGARWKVVRKTKMQGLQLTTEYEYKLSELNSNSAVLTVKLKQKAPKQKIQSKNMPPQFEVFLEKLVSNGSGTIKIDFMSLVPDSKIELKMALNSLVKGGTRKMKMVMKLGIKVLISPFKNFT